MLGPPLDAWYVWLGAAAVSVAVLGVAVAATPAPPANGEAAAATVETVAASEPPAAGRHPIDAARVRVGPRRIDLLGDEAPPAIVRRGPLTPALSGTALRRVALGEPPSAAFSDPAAFAAAARAARSEERMIEPAGDDLVVRSVAWEEVDATLVTA